MEVFTMGRFFIFNFFFAEVYCVCLYSLNFSFCLIIMFAPFFLQAKQNPGTQLHNFNMHIILHSW